MVEIDRGTMPITRTDIAQTSFARKMRVYLTAHAAMAVVVKSTRRIPQADDVVGVISKEHIADSVATSVAPYEA
jgi:hypothetical protein